MSETPLNLTAIRRNYIPEMLEARSQEGSICECQKHGPDSVSVDGDWLHFAGVAFAQALAEVDRLRDMVARLEWFAAHPSAKQPTRGAILDQMTADAQAQGWYDEPVNASQRGGERLPSDEAAAPTQVHPDAYVSPVGSAFRQSSGSSPTWDGIEP